MVRVLLWKEWREQRSLVLGALVLSAALPLFLMAGVMATTTNTGMHGISRSLMPIYMLLVWPLFTAAIAGTAFAADMTDGSMKFLLSRPVSRARVWLVKVGMALAACVAVAIGTSLISITVMWLSAADDTAFRNTVYSQFGGFEAGTLLFAVPFVFLFGCALYCSMFAKRPLTAALAGLVVAAAMAGTIALVWTALVPSSPRLGALASAFGVVVSGALATVCVYAASFWMFSRGDTLDGGARRLAWRPLLAITVVALLGGLAPAAYAGRWQVAMIAADHIGNLHVSGESVIIPELAAGGLSTALVARPLDGSATSVLVPGPATMPTLSPDGEWVVYVAYGGFLQGLRGDAHLRAVRRDGGDDHAISASLSDWRWGYGSLGIVISPDNDRVAFVGDDGDALLTSISVGPEGTVELGIGEQINTSPRNRGVIGWSAREPAELLYYRVVIRPRSGPAPAEAPSEWRGAAPVTELQAFDPASGESRLVREFGGVHMLQLWGSRRGGGAFPARAWAWLPAWFVDDDEQLQLHLIDTDSGDSLELSRSPCGNWGFSADGRRLLYGHCSGELRSGDARVELRERDLLTGTDELFATLDGFEPSSLAREVLPSPDGERLTLFGRRGYGSPWDTYVVPRHGAARPLNARGVAIRWLNQHEVLQLDLYPYGLLRLNVDNGTMAVVFP